MKNPNSEPLPFSPENWDQYSLAQLVSAYHTTHNPEIIGELFQRHKSLVVGVCLKYLKNRMDAEDAASDIFLRLFDLLKKHQPDRFENWLWSVSANHCLAILKNKGQLLSSRFALSIEAIEMEAPEPFDPLEAEEDALRLGTMMDNIGDLPTHQSRCIDLFYFKNMKYADVAKCTGYTLKQVKSYLQNGKRSLRKSQDKKVG